MSDWENENPLILKTHSFLIQTSGVLSVRQRKIFSMLLYCGYHSLKRNKFLKKFTIPVSFLKKFAKLPGIITGELGEVVKQRDNCISTTTITLCQLLYDLCKQEVIYNILGKKKNIEGWGCFSPLAGLEVKHGIITFDFPHQIFESLESLFPEWYASLDLMVVRELKHKSSLSYYQFCKVYQNINTPWMTPEQYANLMGFSTEVVFTERKGLPLRPVGVILNHTKKQIQELEDKVGLFVNHKILYDTTKQNKIVGIRLMSVWKEPVQKYQILYDRSKRSQLLNELMLYLNNKYGSVVQQKQEIVGENKKGNEIGGISQPGQSTILEQRMLELEMNALDD